MRTATLGSNGPAISVVGYGAWEIGGDFWGANPDVDALVGAMRAGFDDGITWVDTAEVYGSGNSEEIVGRAVAGTETLVFTKVAPAPAGSGFAPDQVRAACDASLRRLGRDAIDLYQLHWPDGGVPLEETWATMAALVDAGKVRWIGVSNFDEALIRRCEAIRHVDSLQPEFSMLHRAAAAGLADHCAANGTGIIAYGPLAYGLLTGAITADTTFDDADWRSGSKRISYYDRLFAPGVIGEKLRIVDALRPVAAGLGCTLAQLALAWISHQRGFTGAIAGSRNADHVRQNAAAGTLVLDAPTIATIAEILGA